MILLPDKLMTELNIDKNSIEFLDFLAVEYKIKDGDENIFFIGNISDYNDYKIRLNVLKPDTKKEIMEYAKEWENLSLGITLNGLIAAEKYYPIYSPLCYRGHNWVKDFAN